jgi:hypothetical protein
LGEHAGVPVDDAGEACSNEEFGDISGGVNDWYLDEYAVKLV